MSGNSSNAPRNWCAWYGHQRMGKGTGGIENQSTNGDHPNYTIVKIGQRTEKNPGDLRRLAVTQNSSVRPSADAGGKTLKWVR